MQGGVCWLHVGAEDWLGQALEPARMRQRGPCVPGQGLPVGCVQTVSKGGKQVSCCQEEEKQSREGERKDRGVYYGVWGGASQHGKGPGADHVGGT